MDVAKSHFTYTPWATRRHSARRLGISLLEVLFSVGVVAIGLLGVIAVVPVALRQVGQGQVADAASRAGSNAMREFDAAGMNQASLWRRTTANLGDAAWSASHFQTVTWSPGFDGFWGAPGDDDGWLGAENPHEAGLGDDLPRPDGLPMSNVAFALDPRFIARADRANARTDLALRSVFPYAAPNNPGVFRMMRITLPGSEFFDLPLGTGFGCLSISEADLRFGIGDDLVFNVPEEVEGNPEQVYIWTPGPDGDWGVSGFDDNSNGLVDDINEQGAVGSDDLPFAREFTGAYSWMATLTPKPYQPGQNDGVYTLSVVIFQRRQMDPAAERLALIRPPVSNTDPGGFLGFGVGGGEVVIESFDLSESPQADLDALRPGHWVLLAAAIQNGITGRVETTFGWYRVASVGDSAELNTSTNKFEIDATLAGPDWPVAATALATQVTMIDSIVGVYERTIRIKRE